MSRPSSQLDTPAQVSSLLDVTEAQAHGVAAAIDELLSWLVESPDVEPAATPVEAEAELLLVRVTAHACEYDTGRDVHVRAWVDRAGNVPAQRQVGVWDPDAETIVWASMDARDVAEHVAAALRAE